MVKIIWSCWKWRDCFAKGCFCEICACCLKVYEYLTFITIFCKALDNPRLKTEICRNYAERGHCLYGNSCQFAHGTGVSLLYNIFVKHLTLNTCYELLCPSITLSVRYFRTSGHMFFLRVYYLIYSYFKYVLSGFQDMREGGRQSKYRTKLCQKYWIAGINYAYLF